MNHQLSLDDGYTDRSAKETKAEKISWPRLVSCAQLLKKESGETVYKKWRRSNVGGTNQIACFSLRHQVVVNTSHFTGFDKKMDAVIETTVRKLGYTEAKHLQTKSIKEFVSGNDVFVSVPTGYGYKNIVSGNKFLSLTGYVINSHIPLAQLFYTVSPDSFLRVGRTRLGLGGLLLWARSYCPCTNLRASISASQNRYIRPSRTIWQAYKPSWPSYRLYLSLWL